MSFILYILVFLVNSNFQFLLGYNHTLSVIIFVLSLVLLALFPSRFEHPFVRLPYAVVVTSILLFILLALQDIFIHDTFRYSFKLLQVFALFPALIIISSDIFSSARNYFYFSFLVLASCFFSVFRVIHIGSSLSGCLFCLDNYIYGMRSVAGLNLSGNGCLSLLMLASILIDYCCKYRPFPSILMSFRFPVLICLHVFTFLFAFFIPSRQLFLSLSVFLIVTYSSLFFSWINELLLQLSQLKLRSSRLSYLFVLLVFCCFMFVVVTSEFASAFWQRSAEILEQSFDFVRFKQIHLGFSLALDSILYGQSSETILSILSSAGTQVFENAFLDLIVKYGFLSFFLLILAILFFILKTNCSGSKYLIKVTIVMLVCSFFNEILLETPFWLPLFFAYLFDMRLIYYANDL
jgi:hypothetical protein